MTHGKNNLLPRAGFRLEVSLAGSGEAIVLGAAIVFRFTPLRQQPAGFLHAVHGREQRTRRDMECAPGHLLDAPGDAEAMKFPIAYGFENQKIESTLHDGNAIT